MTIKYCIKCEKDTKRNKTDACIPCNNLRAAKYRANNKAKCAAAEKGYRNRNPEKVSLARDIYLVARPEMAAKFISARKAKAPPKAVRPDNATRDAAIVGDFESGLNGQEVADRNGVTRFTAMKIKSEHTRKAKIETDRIYPGKLFDYLDASLLAFVADLTGTVRVHAAGI